MVNLYNFEIYLITKKKKKCELLNIFSACVLVLVKYPHPPLNLPRETIKVLV